jgi:hypothetical protein
MRRALLFALALVGCSGDDGLSPRDIAGTYALAEVNGEVPGTPLQLAGANCTAAFTSGSLTVMGSGSFVFSASYTYLCVGAPAPGLLLQLVISGDDVRTVGSSLYMTGCGPIEVQSQPCPLWSLSVRPSLPMVTVEFLDARAAFWGDPVFTMGPRQQ